MKQVKFLFAFCFFHLFVLFNADAQEMNARIIINSDKVQGTNKQVYTALQGALTEFVNNRKWTDATFAVNEKIDCTITIIVNEHADNLFKTELQIQARRPVYNSGYTTTLLNFQDKQLDFEYVEFSPLEYTNNTLENNLTATIVYYIYLILGIDFDSFSPKGGATFFQQAQQIVNLTQSQPGWNGWKAFESTRNRHAVITAFTENQADAFREMWYVYHRKGLDEMAANPDRGRTTLIESLSVLEQYKSARPSSVLLQMFADAKLDEIVAVYSKANLQEKQNGTTMLTNIFPAASSRIEAINK
ncbi:MAG: DUF4835 family protein [Tannerellaceae bacterium]|jgi:hypothetical protein|nr:DUF4835 family protein [Tannerellaceae bacterium]